MVGSNFSGTTTYNLRYDLVPVNCAYVLAPASQIFEANGGNGSFTITAGAGCDWTATAGATWVTLTAGARGTGNGQVEFSVAPNPTAFLRSTVINAAGQIFMLEQAGQSGSCTAVPLTTAVPVNGQLSQADCRSRYRPNSFSPANRYRLTLNVGEQVAFSTSNHAPLSLRPTLLLTDENGTLLAESNAVSNEQTRLPQGMGFFTPPTSGTYFLEVVPNSSQAGTYTLRFERTTGCAFSITPGGQRFEASGGTGSFKFVSGNGCNWTVTSNAAWLTLNDNANVTGGGTLNFTVAANNSLIARRATLSAGGQTFNVEQASTNGHCLLQPLAANQTVNGMLTQGDCAGLYPQQFGSAAAFADRYTFTGNAGDQVAVFVNITSSQFFNTLLTLVDPRGAVQRQTVVSSPLPPGSNPFSTLPLSGAYQIEVSTASAGSGQTNSYTLSLLTLPNGCRYSLAASNQSFAFGGGEGSVAITTNSGCAWEAIASANWISLLPNGGSGRGNGTVRFSVAPNESLSSRSATLQIADRVFQIDQGGVGGNCASTPLTPGQLVNGNLTVADCPVGALPNRPPGDRYAFAGRAGEQIALHLLAPAGLTLNVLGPDGVTVLQPDSQTNQGVLRVPSSGRFNLPVTGTYLVEVSQSFGAAEYQLLLSLTPGNCGYALIPESQSVEGAGGPGSVQIRTNNACTWTATSTASWLTVNPASGSGNATLNFNVATNNTGIARTGRLLIGGQEFVLEQAAGASSCVLQPLTLGAQMPQQTVSGTLSPGDCRVRFRQGNQFYPADRFSFTATAGQQVWVSVAGPANQGAPFDLALTDAQGNVLARNLGSFDQRANSLRLPAGSGFLQLPAAGTYQIEVATTSPNITINYTLNALLASGGCGYALTAAQHRFDAQGPNGNQAGQATVQARQGCGWAATTDVSWLLLAQARGSGDGTLNFTIAPNLEENPRTGTILVAVKA